MPDAIYVDGLGHNTAPIPTAARKGPLLMSGGILGRDRATGDIPEGLEDQCRLMFENIRAVLDAAGATPQDIVKLTVFLADKSARGPVNDHWLAMYPDPATRPARHAVETPFPKPILVQCEFTAWLAD